LATRAQDKEYAISTLSIWDTGSPSAKAVSIHMHR
jgi:hypothetical protein